MDLKKTSSLRSGPKSILKRAQMTRDTQLTQPISSPKPFQVWFYFIYFWYLHPQGFLEPVTVNSILAITDKLPARFPFVQNLVQHRICLEEILSGQRSHQRIQSISDKKTSKERWIYSVSYHYFTYTEKPFMNTLFLL